MIDNIYLASRVFDQMYSTVGRPSIPLEGGLKSLLMMALFRCEASDSFLNSWITICCFVGSCRLGDGSSTLIQYQIVTDHLLEKRLGTQEQIELGTLTGMPRVARIVFPSMIYHIVSRGNDRQQIFNDKEDFEKYLEICGRYKDRYGFRI